MKSALFQLNFRLELFYDYGRIPVLFAFYNRNSGSLLNFSKPYDSRIVEVGKAANFTYYFLCPCPDFKFHSFMYDTPLHSILSLDQPTHPILFLVALGIEKPMQLLRSVNED